MLLDEVRPALIITDLMMPGVDGWSLLEHLQSHPSFARIPRVVMTGARNVGTVPGYGPVFVKPVRPADLLRAVRTFTSRPAH